MDFERFVMTGGSSGSSRREMVRVGSALLFMVGIVLFLTSRSGQIHFSLVIAGMIGGYMALLSFAHEANDVANAVGPLAAINEAITQGAVAAKAAIPVWVLMIGASARASRVSIARNWSSARLWRVS